MCGPLIWITWIRSRTLEEEDEEEEGCRWITGLSDVSLNQTNMDASTSVSFLVFSLILSLETDGSICGSGRTITRQETWSWSWSQIILVITRLTAQSFWLTLRFPAIKHPATIKPHNHHHFQFVICIISAWTPPFRNWIHQSQNQFNQHKDFYFSLETGSKVSNRDTESPESLGIN